MIQNTAFGGVDKLPFDLRGRRILQYELNDTLGNKAEEKEILKKQLTGIFHEALKHYGNDYITKEKIVWWGKWYMESKVKVRGGGLHISRVSSDAFFFSISIYDGARSGAISGKAHILTPHSAYARIKTFKNENCEIIFRRRLENGDWLIEIEEGENCQAYHGFNATFSGHYKHSTEMVIDFGFLDEIDFNEIERITGKYLSDFLENFQQFQFGEDSIQSDLTVITTGVKGLYTVMEAIIVLSKSGEVWCAYLDPTNDAIRYFSNISETNRDKPNSIKDWLSKFPEKKIIENDDNQQYDDTEY